MRAAEVAGVEPVLVSVESLPESLAVRARRDLVAGFGASDACMGPASPCAAVTAGESESIFSDGFESGDTGAWSVTTGGS